MEALTELMRDPAAFDVIRRYAALLNGVATTLFLAPEHYVFIDRSSGAG